MPKISIIDSCHTDNITANNGDNIAEVLAKHGSHINANCGGLGKCGKCKIVLDNQEVLACMCHVSGDHCIEINSSKFYGDQDMIDTVKYVSECDIIVDIGTTTVCMAAVDSSGRIADYIHIVNPQTVFASDIIGRISAANHGKLSRMQQQIAKVISDGIRKFEDKNVLRDNYCIYVAGNTTMLHILLNKECYTLGVAPYAPIFVELQRVKCRSIGIKSNSELVTLPCISAYVGADIVAGIHCVGMPSAGKYNILLDLGTNAEIAIFNSSNCYVTSAAAGPCFEGANITCGMNALEGAITAVTHVDGQTHHLVIGNVEPRGICGTGLIDIIAEMKMNEVFDEYGTFSEEGDYFITDKVRVTQRDIRQFQLAKSAIISAVKSLMRSQNIANDDIENYYISGGFSTQMNVESAAIVGLIDCELLTRCIPVKNTSFRGLVKYIIDKGDLDTITKNAQYIDLASDKTFVEEFVANMDFN